MDGLLYVWIYPKEFVFLFTNLDSDCVHAKCSGDHTHVKIEGGYAKPSATYTNELAETTFDQALKKKLRSAARLKNLETPLCNDLLVSGKWSTEKVWHWKKPMHINIQEVLAAVALFKKAAIEMPKTRLVLAMDFNVGLSALVKDRSLRWGLKGPSIELELF